MTKPQPKVREPLFHVAKRNGIVWWKAWLIRLAAILLSLIVCGVIMKLLTGQNPIKVYAAMVKGSFRSSRNVLKLFQDIAILLCIAIAVTPAFKMRFWNLGGEGQVLMGGLMAEICMICIGNKVPEPLLIAIVAVACVAGGALWALIPAFFKAKWNTNESLFTLMMNYVAMQTVAYFTDIWPQSKGSGSPRQLVYGRLPVIFGSQYYLNILIVAVMTVVMYFYLSRSKHGYEISVVGESENTARYVGIDVKKVILRTMALSGAICGIAGMLLVAGTEYSLRSDTAGGRGFTAIMVAWLAKFNPIFMALTSFIIVFLQTGSKEIYSQFHLDTSLADILTGIIIFFIIGCEFFINYSIRLNGKGKNKEGGSVC